MYLVNTTHVLLLPVPFRVLVFLGFTVGITVLTELFFTKLDKTTVRIALKRVERKTPR